MKAIADRLSFRLTIRNVNYGMVPEGITVHNSFRLTIRNVNFEK